MQLSIAATCPLTNFSSVRRRSYHPPILFFTCQRKGMSPAAFLVSSSFLFNNFCFLWSFSSILISFLFQLRHEFRKEKKMLGAVRSRERTACKRKEWMFYAKTSEHLSATSLLFVAFSLTKWIVANFEFCGFISQPSFSFPLSDNYSFLQTILTLFPNIESSQFLHVFVFVALYSHANFLLVLNFLYFNILQ